jgi:predicted RNA-binding protein YlqC (UPF0109 family)
VNILTDRGANIAALQYLYNGWVGAVEFRVLIANRHVGSIIGKAGNNIQRVRDRSGAAISINKLQCTQPHEVSNRVMTIRGLPHEVAIAIAQVSALIYDAHRRDHGENVDVATEFTNTIVSTSICLMVHEKSIGDIIGKAGVVIHQTQAQTGCSIQISNDVLPMSTEKTIQLTGKIGTIHEAAKVIIQQLQRMPLTPGTISIPYNPEEAMQQQHPFGRNPPTLPMHPPAGALLTTGVLTSYPATPPVMQSAAASSAQQIAIPASSVGTVIGKGGATIRALRVQSNTAISIGDAAAGSNERIVTLTGTVAGIQTAVYLVRQLVEKSSG